MRWALQTVLLTDEISVALSAELKDLQTVGLRVAMLAVNLAANLGILKAAVLAVKSGERLAAVMV